MRLTKRKVFDKYNKSLSHYRDNIIFKIYKLLRLRLSKIFPLSNTENILLESHDNHFMRESVPMPSGIDHVTGQSEDGYLKLEYIVLFDYLPKEKLDQFIKSIKQYTKENTLNPLRTYESPLETLKTPWIKSCYDDFAQSSLTSVKFVDSPLSEYFSDMDIFIYNLSSSFLIVSYRFFLQETTQNKFNALCKRQYVGCSDSFRAFDMPWYKPLLFRQSLASGNQVRERAVYQFLTTLKWNAYQSICKSFRVYFSKNNMFPPTFECYRTNIPPDSTNANLPFWYSVMFQPLTDYAPERNLCVNWGYDESLHEGMRLAAYLGENDFAYKGTSHLHYSISDYFAGYLVSNTMIKIAERKIADCNRKISKMIHKSSSAKILKLRVKIDQELHHLNRFTMEFSGKSIRSDIASIFCSDFFSEKNSFTASNFKYLPNAVKNAAQMISNTTRLLDNAAEYRNAKSNMTLQGWMAFVTVLSLFAAIVAVGIDNWITFFTCVFSLGSRLFEWFKLILN